ncbi:MAG: polysaccharide biosynthesis C-terminal domain-containing protein [Bacteroidota bacterium]
MTVSPLVRAGQFAQAARQGAIILVALALPRLGVGREVIGEWEGLLYVGYLLGFGWLTGLLQAYLVRIRLTRPALTATFSRLAIVGIGVFSALLLSLAALLHEGLFSVLRLGEAPTGWWWFFAFLLTQWPGLFFEQVLLIREKAWELAAFGGLSALGFALAILLPLYHGADLATALFWLALTAGAKGVLLMSWVLLDRWRNPPPPPVSEGPRENELRPLLREWLRTAWPLITYAVAGTLVTAFDPWFVNYWYADDEAIFATFRYGARELPLLAAIINGTMVVVLPRLTEAPVAGLDLLKASSRRLFHWIFGGATLLMLTSPWWWTLVFTDLFAGSLPLFQAYLLLVISRLIFPTPVLTAFGHTRLLALISLSELLSNLALSWLLATYFGLLGIIWATVIADILNRLVLVWYLYYRTGIPPGRYIDLRVFVGYCLVLVVAYLLV